MCYRKMINRVSNIPKFHKTSKNTFSKITPKILKTFNSELRLLILPIPNYFSLKIDFFPPIFIGKYLLMIEGTTLRPAGNASGSTFVQTPAGLYKRPTGRTM